MHLMGVVGEGVGDGVKNKIPDGVWPVMLTPFTKKGRIDFQGLEKLTDWYIGQGVQGLFSACLSSEALQMTDADKLALVKHVVEQAAGRVPVVAGVLGVADRARRIDMAQEVVGFGAKSAVLTLCDIVPQAASDTDWIEEMDQHLQELRGIPLGLYECPWPYLRTLTPTLTDYVIRHPEFLFLKETSGDLDEMERKSRAGAVSGLKVFSADARTLGAALRRGLNGFSGLQTNLWPALPVKLCRCWRTDPELAERLQRFLVEYDWAVSRSYPASAKLYLKTAHGLAMNSLSFLNGASVEESDQEWIDELAQIVRDFMEETGKTNQCVRSREFASA